MGAVRLAGGKKVFRRQGQALWSGAVGGNPDNALLGGQGLHREMYRGRQLRYREDSEILPPEKPQEFRAF